MACRVVCISRELGAGGEEAGRLVAERLGFLYVDEEIVAGTAARAGVDLREVADEERRKSLAARVLEAIAESGVDSFTPGGGVPFSVGEQLSSAEIRALIRETIVQTAARGNVVIVAHAASHALGQGAETLRVLVTASPATRARRVGERDGLDPERAARVVKESDAARHDYLKRFYEIDRELPTHYDLVVNTDVLSVEEAAQIVTHAGSR